MIPKSIRVRLTFWYVGLLIVTFIVLGGAAYGLLSYSLSREMDNALKNIASVMAERPQSEVGSFFPPDVEEIFRRFLGYSPLDRYFRMLDPQGRRGQRQATPPADKLPLSREALAAASQGIPTFETLEGLEKYPVRLLTAPVTEAGRVTGLVQVGMSLQSIVETRTRFLLIMAGLLPIGAILAGLGGWMLAGRALSPVDRLTETAKRIGAERLGERVKETGAGDELDRLAKTLNDMLGRLDTAFNQVRRFAADASHELQTPLTIMKGELEVALRATRTPREYESAMRSVLEEVDRISRLVDGLLLLARTDAGALGMDRTGIELIDLGESVFLRLKAQAESKSVALDFDIKAPVRVDGDRERLMQLLTNIVENGIKYTPSGGRTKLSVGRSGRWALIEVSDTGIGIPVEDRERIFQPFFRTLGAETQKGAGLGLAIAKSIAGAHGGRIEVDDAPGGGSVFRIFLPLAADAG